LEKNSFMAKGATDNFLFPFRVLIYSSK